MKNQLIWFIGLVLLLSFIACNDEDAPVASDNLGIVDRFGPKEDDAQEVKDIYENYGVWVRTHFEDINELANAIIAEDQMVSMFGATNILNDYIPETYDYTTSLLSNVSKDFIKKYFPLEFFFVETCGTGYWSYDLLSIGRSRLVICWPNQMAGCIPVTDSKNHYYQDSVLTVGVWEKLSGMITARMEEDLIPDFIAAGKVYDGGEAYDKILNEYYADEDEEKYERLMSELAQEGGFITGSGSRDFRSDLGEWIQLLMTDSYDNIKKNYLDTSIPRAKKYEIFTKWLKDNFNWDIQVAGNTFREKYDAYKATLLPSPSIEEE